MRKIVLVISILFTCSAHAQLQDSIYMFSYFKGNGEDGLHLAWSKDGFNWTALRNDHSLLAPTVASDKLMRDPCIIRGGDGLFHMVWTVSWNDRMIGYANSKDLLHWSPQLSIPVMAHEPTARNCWAPEIFFDADSGNYMIYWATTIPGRFPDTDSSGDGGYNHRIYYCLTKDFTSFSKTALLFDPGFNVIDATIQKNADQYLMVCKDETRYPPAKNLFLAKSDSLCSGYKIIERPITGDYWAEGPTLVTSTQGWNLYFDKYRDHKYGIIQSNDLQQWTDLSDQLHMPEGIRHGSVFKISETEWQSLTKNILNDEKD